MKDRTIFLAPLDWGLGHATRCVPLVKELLRDNAVILGTTPLTAPILQEEFPDLKKIPIEPYAIRYSKYLPPVLKLLLDWPRIRQVMAKEQAQLETIVDAHGIDLVISDNRPGLHHRNVECIYLTHQLNIQAGLWSDLANRIHRQYMRRFKTVWVPDFEERNRSLAGSLSENKHSIPASYIGPLSRLHPAEHKDMNIDYLVLLSGPEPQRSILEALLRGRFRNTNEQVILVRGTLLPADSLPTDQLTVIDLAGADDLSQLIARARTVVCRSGYSSLMDLHAFDHKRLVLIPTPGQPEQEYLARYWQNRFGAYCLLQKDIPHWKP